MTKLVAFLTALFSFAFPVATAESTSSTGPCQVGVELRGFPKPDFSQLVGYTSYVCPEGATNINITWSLQGTKANGTKVRLTEDRTSSAPDISANQASVSNPVFTQPVSATDRATYTKFQLKTSTTYTVNGQTYTQAVISDPGSVLR